MGALENRITPTNPGDVANATEVGRLLTLPAAAALATGSLLS
jgi:hypothetical protein